MSTEPTTTKSEPYWWEAAPLRSIEKPPLASAADVVIVGAGYTGLSAAITLARAGRSVLLFDKQRPGEGASSRNGGITSGNIRPSLSQMTRSFGEERAKAILTESKAAREDLYRFIREENIDCDLALTGRFAGAAAPGDYEHLARDADYLNRTFGIEAYAVPRAEQRNVLGTDYYYGGNVRMDVGGLHPGKFLAEMLRLALTSGAVLHSETAVLGIVQERDSYEVTTSRGTMRARDVVIGTNGYTDGSNPWLRRRLVALRSRIIATAPISPNLMGALMPRRMMISDTRHLSYYYRPSPDGTRILFGGRDGTLAGQGEGPTKRLRSTMVSLFPELADTVVTHSWYGYVAMNRDMVPRIFTRQGMRYATGYCGSGVVWARWAGRKAALQVLGQDGSSALDFRPPAAVPLFNGTAWFMPAYMSWLTLQDALKDRQRRQE